MAGLKIGTSDPYRSFVPKRSGRGSPHMKSQTLILLVIAGGCGLVTLFGVKQAMNGKEETATVKVLVATKTIKMGEALNKTNVEERVVPVDSCPRDVVRDIKKIADRAVKSTREPGDWICEKHLSAPGDRGVTIPIPKGKRVVTINVNNNSSHSGLVRPGNRVDLLFTYESREKDRRVEKTVVLLEYVEVFAVANKVYGRDSVGDSEKISTMSLLVTTDEAARITHVENKGTISTSLRSAEDDELGNVAAVTDEFLNDGVHSIDKRSSHDVRAELAENFSEDEEIGGFVLPDEEETKEPENEVVAGLAAELEDDSAAFASAPVPKEEKQDEFWLMAIHEHGTVRVARVNLNSEDPIDTTAGFQAPGAPAPTQPINGESVGQLPAGSGLPELPEALEGLQGVSGLEGGDVNGPGKQRKSDLPFALGL